MIKNQKVIIDLSGVARLMHKIKIVAIGAMGLVGYCTAVVIWGWQLISFLKSGGWTPFSLIDLMEYAGNTSPWIKNPDTWIGLHSAFSWVNGGVAVLAISALLWLMFLTDSHQ